MTSLLERFSDAEELAEWLLEHRTANMVETFEGTLEYVDALNAFALDYAKRAMNGTLEIVYGDTVDEIMGDLQE